MELNRSRALVPKLLVLDTAGSTNDVLADLVRDGDEPPFSTVVTLDQTWGRGRLGRVWIAPRNKTLAASVLLRPLLSSGDPLPPSQLGWLPLIAGVAMAVSVDALVGGGRAGLKWPNDVQVDGLKVCGVLTELLPSGAVIVGTGVNLTLAEDELPVPTATSLALAGADAAQESQPLEELVDLVLSHYLDGLSEYLGRFLAAGGDAETSGIRRLTSEWCRTLGREVRVSLPGASEFTGTAVEIDAAGCLVVRRDFDSSVVAIAAADITHLRYA